MIRRAFSTAAILVALTATPAAAAVTTYTDQTAFDAAVTTALLEDFEGVSPGLTNTPLASFSRYGVTYEGLAGVPFLNVAIAAAPVLYTNFGVDIPIVGGTQLTSSVMAANGDEDILATFSQGYHALGMDLYFNGRGPAVLAFLDFNGDTITSLTSSDGYRFGTTLADIGFGGVVSSTEIWGFRWTTTEGGQKNTGFDNIRVAERLPGGIPEPSTWALMVLAFAAAGAALRRARPPATA